MRPRLVIERGETQDRRRIVGEVDVVAAVPRTGPGQFAIAALVRPRRVDHDPRAPREQARLARRVVRVERNRLECDRLEPGRSQQRAESPRFVDPATDHADA